MPQGLFERINSKIRMRPIENASGHAGRNSPKLAVQLSFKYLYARVNPFTFACTLNKESNKLQLITTPIGRLRLAGWAEGTTLLIMLCVAMPLKYWANVGWVVPIVGPVHGACFSLYLVLACSVVFDGTWNARQVTRVLVAAIMPFGTFANDPFLAAKCRTFSAVETAAIPNSSTKQEVAVRAKRKTAVQ